MLFSDAIRNKDQDTQRRLHSLFSRAVKAGDVPALKLLDKFTVKGRNGEARQVQDYAIPESAAEQLMSWVECHANKPTGQRKGYTVADVEAMTETYMLELIQAQNKPKKARKPRKPKE